MPKKINKKKPKSKPKTKTIKQKQKQKQITIVNVYYDKGKRRVGYKKTTPKAKAPPPVFQQPRFVIPEVRYIANYNNNQSQNQVTDLIKLITNNINNPSAFTAREIYDRNKNNAFLDQVAKDLNEMKTKYDEEDSGLSKKRADAEDEGRQDAGDVDPEMPDVDPEMPDDVFQMHKEYYILLYKYIKHKGKPGYAKLDSRIGYVPTKNNVLEKIQIQLEKESGFREEWRLRDDYVEAPPRPNI